MKLTLEQIKRITVGALRIWEEDGAFCFAKCTSKQVEAWYKRRQTLGERAETTTGIRLDFHTNSATFAFTPVQETKYEIYIDDILTYAYSKADFAVERQKQIELDGKEHRITLYFPSHDRGVLETVEIDDGAMLVPHKFDCKILFIGDSITQGWEAKWDSLSFAYQVSRFFNAESVIQGIGGAYYHDTTFDKDIEYDPDIVIVAYGTNDWGNTYESMDIARMHCAKFLEQVVARYGDKKLFGILPIWRADAETPTKMGMFEDCLCYIQEELVRHGMIVIDGQMMTPHIKDFYADGYLHPNTKGFGIYALHLIKELQKHLN